ncbi:MAG TPA: zf-HC2 domain-containing protein [Acidimicrobiia bacterium]|nr:zf-HC2 domain-containing protein [Acidimicrobiia bacterium]
MSHSNDIHDQLELYAAGALDDKELIAFDNHLSRCALCRSRTPALFEAVAALIPDSPPPDGTWDRIVSAIGRA